MPYRCPVCDGTGKYKESPCPMCNASGLVESLTQFGQNFGQFNEPNENNEENPENIYQAQQSGDTATEARKAAMERLLSKGVVDLSKPEEQFEFMNLISSGNYTVEDITDSPDLTPSLKAATEGQVIVVNDGLLKGGRTYAIRSKWQTNVLEKKVLGYALDGTLPPGPTVVPLVLQSETMNDAIQNRSRSARWKRFDQLMLTFWNDPNRMARNTTLPRTILLEIVPNFPTKTLQPAEALTNVGPPYNLPDPAQPGRVTSTILYQVDAAHNPTHQLMSDLVITRNPAIYLPRYYELRLTINLVGGPCFCDAMIVQTVLR